MVAFALKSPFPFPPFSVAWKLPTCGMRKATCARGPELLLPRCPRPPISKPSGRRVLGWDAWFPRGVFVGRGWVGSPCVKKLLGSPCHFRLPPLALLPKQPLCSLPALIDSCPSSFSPQVPGAQDLVDFSPVYRCFHIYSVLVSGCSSPSPFNNCPSLGGSRFWPHA